MDEPITWAALLGFVTWVAVSFLVVLAIYGLGRHFGWWDRGDGPGVE